MKKIKIKFSNELFKLKNFLIDKFKKLNKFIEFKIITFINKYFPNKLNKYKKLKNITFVNISNLSMSIILFISLLFIYLFYVSIPTIYNKGVLQKDITDKLIKEFKIDFSLSSNIRYFILPSPHFLIENVKIFDENLKDPKEISQIKKLKIYISQKNLYDRNNLKITKILIEDANFIFQKKNTKFYDNYIKGRFSKKKVIIKNSNFFLNNNNNNTISLIPIKNPFGRGSSEVLIEKRILSVDESGSRWTANELNKREWDAILHLGLCGECTSPRIELRS